MIDFQDFPARGDNFETVGRVKDLPPAISQSELLSILGEKLAELRIREGGPDND